jgi:hypothetical protein
MCTPSIPATPSTPERQATQLPDQGATTGTDNSKTQLRRAVMASISTSAQGALGTPNVGAPTLGS